MIRVIAAVFLFSIASSAVAQDAAKIQALEARVAQLEAKIDLITKILDKIIKMLPPQAVAQPVAVAKGGDAQPKAVWRTLKLGMSMDDARKILGEPDRVMMQNNGVNGVIVQWIYRNTTPAVGFALPNLPIATFRDGKLVTWEEP